MNAYALEPYPIVGKTFFVVLMNDKTCNEVVFGLDLKFQLQSENSGIVSGTYEYKDGQLIMRTADVPIFKKAKFQKIQEGDGKLAVVMEDLIKKGVVNIYANQEFCKSANMRIVNLSKGSTASQPAFPKECADIDSKLNSLAVKIETGYQKNQKLAPSGDSVKELNKLMPELDKVVSKYPDCKPKLDITVRAVVKKLTAVQQKANANTPEKTEILDQKNTSGYAQENVMKPKKNKGACKQVNMSADQYKSDRFLFFSSMGLDCQSLPTAVVCAGNGIIVLSFNFFHSLKECEDHLRSIQ